jgi:hypothetical protein
VASEQVYSQLGGSGDQELLIQVYFPPKQHKCGSKGIYIGFDALLQIYEGEKINSKIGNWKETPVEVPGFPNSDKATNVRSPSAPKELPGKEIEPDLEVVNAREGGGGSFSGPSSGPSTIPSTGPAIGPSSGPSNGPNPPTPETPRENTGHAEIDDKEYHPPTKHSTIPTLLPSQSANMTTSTLLPSSSASTTIPFLLSLLFNL